MARRAKKNRRYGSAASRTKKAAAVSGPGGGGTMFQNIPSETNFYNPEEGKVTLRLLPYVVTDPKHPDGDAAPVNDIWYKRPLKRFRQIGVENKSYISPRSIGKPCPVIEYYQAAKADPTVSDKEANKAKPQEMVLYNVQTVDRKGKVSDPMFWFFSYYNFEEQLKAELLDPDNEEFAAFMDLEGGFDIRVRWAKKTFAGSDFFKADSIQFLERDEDIDEDILDRVVDLDNCLTVKPYDELKNIFLEIDDDDIDSGDENQEEAPVNKRPGRKKKEEKEESEETPAKPRGRRKKTAEPKKDECPNGLKFGADYDSDDKCDKCDVIDECEKAFNKESPEPATPSKSDSGKDSGKCPHSHNFGVDCDSNDDCEECKIWDDCIDEQEKLAS